MFVPVYAALAAHDQGFPCAVCGQVKGKGTWGPVEGIEKLYDLPPAAAGFVNNPLNAGRVQQVLDAVPAALNVLVKDSGALHNTGFSGAKPTSVP